MILLLSACSHSQNKTESKFSSATDLDKRSSLYVKQFSNDQFDQFYDENKGIDKKIPKKTFAKEWKNLITEIGPNQGIKSKKNFTKNKNKKVSIETKHKKYNLKTTFTYTKEGKATDVKQKIEPLKVKPQKSDKWNESPIKVGYNEKKLNGMITLPKNEKNPPVAILLQGSGQNNMDSVIGKNNNRPIADIAHGLAKRGIASIRYDKRSYTYPKDVTNIQEEYLYDAKSAVKIAGKDKRLNNRKIYLIGHSQGGSIGPKIIEENPEIKAFVSMSGTLAPLENKVLSQTKMRLSQDKTHSKKEKKKELKKTEAEVAKIKEINASNNNDQLLGYPISYWSSLNKIDNIETVKNINVPMFITRGTSDFQVSSNDYNLWKKTIGDRENVKFKSYPGLNHIYTKGGSSNKFDGSIYNKPAQVSSEVIKDISNWIKKQ